MRPLTGWRQTAPPQGEAAPHGPPGHDSGRQPPSAFERAARLMAALLLLLVMALPLGWFGLGWRLQADAAAEEAALVAWAVSREPAAAADSALRSLSGPLNMGDAQVQVRLHDAAGRLVAAVGAQPHWPWTEARSALQRLDGEPGSVRVLRGLQPVLLQAAALSLCAALLAVLLWWRVFHAPLSALQQAERQIRRHARTDGLTGLLNREGLRESLHRVMAGRADGRRRSVGVLVFDIDRFTLVNATVGQAGGDHVLRVVAERLAGVIPRRDALARLAGDQFAVVTTAASSAEALQVLALNLLRAVEAPIAVEGRELQLSCSVGSTWSPVRGGDEDLLLRQAGAALRAAQQAGGGGHRGFDESMRDDAAARMELDQHLRRALKGGQFFLVYQPIVDARTHRITAVEALIRWSAPGRGVVSPTDFVPLLEESGLIVQVGHWVLHEACRRAAQWRREGEMGLILSVNLSPRQFADADFVQHLRGALLDSGFPPQQLQLEVTESLLLDPSPGTLRRFDELARLGVRLAVDDFGVGYSSLAYLKRFQLHALKIDRLFVQDVGHSARDLAIVRAIVELGHSLGLHVTAEGVEEPCQSEALADVGCDALQGYLFARPQPADALPLGTRAGSTPDAQAPQAATASSHASAG